LAREGIRNFFKSLLDELENRKAPRVCLIAHSLSSDVFEEADLESYVEAGVGELVARLAARLTDAKKTGELSPDFPAEIAAQVIFTYLQGFFPVVNVLSDQAQMERQIEALLVGLGI
jgi:AcrR family transcriptional regulator